MSGAQSGSVIVRLGHKVIVCLCVWGTAWCVCVFRAQSGSGFGAQSGSVIVFWGHKMKG